MSNVTKFEVGKTYSTRSIGDHNCIIRVTIAKRTAKTVTTTDGKTFRPTVYNNAESIMPWGRYSMAPSVDATDTADLKPDWEKPAPAPMPTCAEGGTRHVLLGNPVCTLCGEPPRVFLGA
jgi:hypothetical protein